jgi:drug/metabolite transporter (DMT)-like permease
MTALALVIVQLFFASLAVIGRVVLPVMSPGVLVTMRIVGAAVAMLLFNLLRGGPWIRDRRVLARIALAGLLGVTANQALFLYGLKHTTAVNATILVTTVPVFTVLGSLLLGLERPSLLKLAGIALAAAGAIYLVGPDRLSLDPGVGLGNLLILCGMICYAAYFLVSKPVVARHDPISVSAYVMGFAALGILPIGVPAIATSNLHEIPSRIWWMAAYLVAGPTIGAYFLNLWALRRASSNTVATFIYLQPVFAAMSAPLLLDEPLAGRTIAAALIIFTGLGLVLFAERSQQREATARTLSVE